jgi:hypothetical protein
MGPSKARGMAGGSKRFSRTNCKRDAESDFEQPQAIARMMVRCVAILPMGKNLTVPALLSRAVPIERVDPFLLLQLLEV